MRTLADRLARGEDSAFAELYGACADQLYRYAAARLGSTDVAADVVQTTFLRAVKSRRKFRQVENPIAYMFQIVRNETIRSATSDQRRFEQMAADSTPAGDNRDEAADDAEALQAALRRLDEEDREIIDLKIRSGLTFAEIAEVMKRPQGTVATRYRRAIESLRSWLAREFSRE